MSEMYVGAMALGNPAVEYYIPGDLHISQMEGGGVLEWWEECLVAEIQFVDQARGDMGIAPFDHSFHLAADGLSGDFGFEGGVNR